MRLVHAAVISAALVAAACGVEQHEEAQTATEHTPHQGRPLDSTTEGSAAPRSAPKRGAPDGSAPASGQDADRRTPSESPGAAADTAPSGGGSGDRAADRRDDGTTKDGQRPPADSGPTRDGSNGSTPSGGTDDSSRERNSGGGPSSYPPWRLAIEDHFNGPLNRNIWTKYAQNDRRAENAFTRNGKLILRVNKENDRWWAGGVTSAKALKQKYGKYTIRARVDRGYGTRAVALLWPSGEVWPPEVDFFEIPGDEADRRTNYVTNHYGAENHMRHKSYRADFTRWHRIGVQWTPKVLRFTLDRRVVRTIHTNVPQRRMWLGLQSATGTNAKPRTSTPTPVDFEIDWVRMFRYVPPPG